MFWRSSAILTASCWRAKCLVESGYPTVANSRLGKLDLSFDGWSGGSDLILLPDWSRAAAVTRPALHPPGCGAAHLVTLIATFSVASHLYYSISNDWNMTSRLLVRTPPRTSHALNPIKPPKELNWSFLFIKSVWAVVKDYKCSLRRARGEDKTAV